uniref:Uncharacterized protein n=1 Tax=Verrucosispora sp. MS100047 TaxID=1410949 RepID=A0A097CS97_9ACTN|nr:hypothetical protein VASRM7_289 [Verrucosispora sp. MS100047]
MSDVTSGRSNRRTGEPGRTGQLHLPSQSCRGTPDPNAKRSPI